MTATLTLREAPADNSAFQVREAIYEIALRTPVGNPWLKDISNAHRLLRTWLLAQSQADGCRILNFSIRPDGFLMRVSLTGGKTLGEFLEFVREKSTPPHQTAGQSWAPEPAWLRLLNKAKLGEAEHPFLSKSEVSVQETVGLFSF
jgi:hypothetical protein